MEISDLIFQTTCVSSKKTINFFLYKPSPVKKNVSTQPFDDVYLKNPAYGRQSISRPMRIVAPIPQVGWTKNSQKPKFFEKRKKSSKKQKLIKV